MHKGVKKLNLSPSDQCTKGSKQLKRSISACLGSFKKSFPTKEALHTKMKVTLELKTRTIFFQHSWIMSIYKFHLIKSRYVLIMSKHSTAAVIYTMHISIITEK